MPSVALPALGTSRTVRHILRRRRDSCSNPVPIPEEIAALRSK